MKQKLAVIGRILILAIGMATSAVAVLVMVTSGELAVRVTALVALSAGVIILLLASIIDKVSVFGKILRHMQYLTQSSQYTARLVQEITEVMRTIQEMEEQQQSSGGNQGNSSGVGKGGGSGYVDELSPEELELASTVRQFED